MMIICPNCQAAYRLPEEKLQSQHHDYKAHCKQCGEVIHLHGLGGPHTTSTTSLPIVHSETAVADPPHEPSWFCAAAGHKVGPLTLDQVGQHLLTHELAADDLIWRAGFVEWLPVRDVSLFARWLETADAGRLPGNADPVARQVFRAGLFDEESAGTPPPLPHSASEAAGESPFPSDLPDALPVAAASEPLPPPPPPEPAPVARLLAGKPTVKVRRPYVKSPLWLGVVGAAVAGLLGVVVTGFRTADEPVAAAAPTPAAAPVSDAPVAPAPAIVATRQEAKLIVATAPQPVALVATAPSSPTAEASPTAVALPKRQESPPPLPTRIEGPGLTVQQVNTVAVRAAPQVSRCYGRHAESGAQKETLVVQLTVNADGTVAASKIRGKHATDAVGTCVPEAVKNLHFPPTIGPERTYAVRFVVGGA
jgi:predicted Zn finger-like uncharacterized protein